MPDTIVKQSHATVPLRLQYLLVFVLSGILYVLTCAPSILWQDSALLTYRIFHDALTCDLGLAIAHPLYIMVGMIVKQIPLGELAHRVNLMSAVFGAIAVANVYVLVTLWLGNRLAAAVATITLAVSWTFWQNAVIAEVYTLYAAIFTAELIALLKYTQTSRVGWLYLLAFLNGLSIADHMWGILPLACYAVFVVVLLRRRAIGPGHVLVCAALWVAGALPYEYLIVDEMMRTGNIGATLASAAFGAKWKGQVLNTSLTAKVAAENVAFMLLNFPTPNIILLFLGVFVARRVAPRSFSAVLLGSTVLFFVFAFRYTVPDRHAFFFPFYICAALCIGAGAHALSARYNSRLLKATMLLLAFLPVGVYLVTPTIARHAYKSLGQRRQVPYRDDYKYWLQPWQTGYRGAERFAVEALNQVPQNAVIYADSTTGITLLFIHETRGIRPDVRIITQHLVEKDAPALDEHTFDRLIDESAFYVVSAQPSYCPSFILEKYDTFKEGVLYRVLKRRES